jgi:hypothetical protein
MTQRFLKFDADGKLIGIHGDLPTNYTKPLDVVLQPVTFDDDFHFRRGLKCFRHDEPTVGVGDISSAHADVGTKSPSVFAALHANVESDRTADGPAPICLSFIG